MELVIVVVVYNQPEFLRYQYRGLKKFIKNSFRLMIFDNSDNDIFTNQFVDICNELSLEYVRVPQNIHTNQDASQRAGKSLDYALQFIYNTGYRDIVMVNDSDLFLINNYNPLERIGNYEIIGRSIKNIYERDEAPNHPINKYKIDYFSNQFLIFNFSKIIDIYKISFEPTILNNIGLDCGGKLYEYIKNNTNNFSSVIDYCTGYNIIEINSLTDINKSVKEYLENDININGNGKTYSEVFDNNFLHFRAGSNWINQNNFKYIQRCENLYNFYSKIII